MDKWMVKLHNRRRIWKQDPVLFSKELLRIDLDDWQKQVIYDIRDYPRVSVKSGQGVGKTSIEAVVLLWFLTCFNYPRIVATAPTKQQLHDVLWSEIDKWMNNSPVLPAMLMWTKTYVYMRGYEKRSFAVARTATRPENMQGFHEENMLFIVDEASGVAEPIMEAITGTLSGENNKLLLMGNPTRTSGTFYDSHTADRALYRCHTVNAELSDRTNKDNIAAMKRKYGEDSNVVKVRVYGEFPEQEDDVFIPISWLEQSVRTEMTTNTALALGLARDAKGHPLPIDVSGVERIQIGCDVARYGDDRTVIGHRVNEKIFIDEKKNGQDTTWTASTIAQMYLRLKKRFKYDGVIPVAIDDGGVGGGVTDQLRSLKRTEPELYRSMMIVAINFGQKLSHHKYYADTTTYMMGVVKELIAPYDDNGQPHTPEIILPDDSDLIGELSCRKYSFVNGAKQKVESKKEMKARGLHSPDEADCVLLVCLPVNKKKEGGNGRK